MLRYLTVLLTLALSSLVWADFDAAADAYRRKDYVTAFEEFIALARAGDARAQTVIAMMYKYGESTAADPAEAFYWYQQAANAGYAPAMFNVGDMYRQGLGIEQDTAQAIDWLTRAAEAGFERANDSLARLNAEPVSSDHRRDPAIPWSQSWNFRLPNDIRFAAPDTATERQARYRVQLGAMGTRAAADRLWQWLSQNQPRLFADLEPIVLLTQRGERSIYRVQAGPFTGFESAQRFCENLSTVEPRADCLPLPAR